MGRYKTPLVTERPARQVVPNRPLLNAVQSGWRNAGLRPGRYAELRTRFRTTRTDIRLAIRQMQRGS